jgi:hypothetical protein
MNNPLVASITRHPMARRMVIATSHEISTRTTDILHFYFQLPPHTGTNKLPHTRTAHDR